MPCQKQGHLDKLKNFFVNTVETAFFVLAAFNLFRMFVFMIARPSSNIGLNTKSLGQIEGKSC